MNRSAPAPWPINALWPHVLLAGSSLACERCRATTRAQPGPNYGASVERFLAEHRRCEPGVLVAPGTSPGVRYLVRGGKCLCPGFAHHGRCRHVREAEALTPGRARERLRSVAREIAEASEREAVARFLERVAGQQDAEELCAALVLVGAEAVVREARA